MKVGIMQPYFVPYIGYFQLINAVDKFVIYDNIQYTKRGWINRNRILNNVKDEFITIPLKKSSDYLNVVDRQLSNSSEEELNKLLRKIENNYRKAPYLKTTMPLVYEIFNCSNKNLFYFLYAGILKIVEALSINTKIVISSTLKINHGLKGQDKVLAICKYFGADTYINAIGGVSLYNKAEFKTAGINLQFINTNKIKYNQFTSDFVPLLSIIDVMMFNSKEEVISLLNKEFKLI